MLEKIYADYAWEQAASLLAIDSPSGYTKEAAIWVKNAFESLGFSATITVKGGVLVDLGGKDENDALLLEAHADTLGCMVAEVKGNGRLRLTALGGRICCNSFHPQLQKQMGNPFLEQDLMYALLIRSPFLDFDILDL